MKILVEIALKVPEPVTKIENRFKCIGKRKRFKRHEDNCQSKGKKDNIPMPKEQCQSCDKSICQAHSMIICYSCLQ